MALLLASGSPQRRNILEQLGLPFRVWVPDLAEGTHGEPAALALHNSRLKADAALPHASPDEVIVAVDTVVALGDTVYGKPSGEHEAGQMLRRLCGRRHQVFSGLTVLVDGQVHGATACTEVRFREFDDVDLRTYLATGEWEGRAGGYAIQASGAALVDSVNGDFYNVVGFPVSRFLDLVRELSLRDRVSAVSTQ